MTVGLGRFRAALVIGWVVLSAAGVVFAQLKSIPILAALPIVAAFLLEYPFYLVTGFPTVREKLAGRMLPLILTASMVIPYLVCCCGPVTFHWIALAKVTALPLVLSFWYVWLPKKGPVDAAFLLVIGAAMLGGYFKDVYPRFYGQHLEFLGAIGLIHIILLVLMLVRRIPETGWGFWPTRREWSIGFRHFLYFLVLGIPIALLLGAIHSIRVAPVWVVFSTLLGYLLVSSLFEEFLFRGVLQHWMEEWTTNRTAALLVTSVVYGFAHLWYRGFPNWRWVPIAFVLGVFCGRARNQAGGIRAGVVVHALVVTTWRGFFA